MEHKMDLVSSTLNKYLKHRFNGNGLERKEAPGNDSVAESGDNNNISSVIVPRPTIEDISVASNSTQSAQNNTNQGQINSLTDSSNLTNFINNSNATVTENSTNSASQTFSSEQKANQESITILNANHTMSNGTGNNDCKLPTIHTISISNTQPCCVTLRGDLQFLAAGFENSHIYLWSFKEDTSEMIIASTSTLLAHSGPVYSIEFVSNNDLMLSCSEDTTIRLWCLNTKCNVLVYRGHNYPIWSLDVGSQGLLFASASMDATARLWRIDKMTPLRIFCGHDDDVECVKFHPNEKYIATGSSDATIRLWSVSDGKMVRLMVGHQNPIISLSFLPDGKFLASASRDGVIKVWNLATNSVTNELSVPASFTISFSLDQKFVSSCGVDNVLRLWQLDEANLIEKKNLDFRAKASNLIQSHFHRDNKLYVIDSYEEKSKTN